MIELIKKAKNGNCDAFIDLINLNMQSLYKVAWTYLKNDEDVADAIQDTILSSYEKINSLKKDKYFKTWLIRILINKCNDILRKRNVFLKEGEVFEQPFEEIGYLECEWKEMLSFLDEKYQAVILLYYGESYRIVADVEQEKEDTELIDYTVREALCDSNSIYIVVEASAKDLDKYLFVPEDAIEEDLVKNWGIESELSLKDYAKEKNKEIFYVCASIANVEELGMDVLSIDFQSKEDDIMDICISGNKENDSKKLDISCIGTAYSAVDGEVDKVIRSEMKFVLEDISNSEKTSFSMANLSTIGDTDILISRVEANQTELGAYLSIFYKTNNAENIAFRLVDENGEEIDGSLDGSGYEQLEDGSFNNKLAYRNFLISDKLSIEVFNLETKEVYGIADLIKN